MVALVRVLSQPDRSRESEWLLLDVPAIRRKVESYRPAAEKELAVTWKSR